ncbi:MULTISPECIES: NYN domain-containing protein [unclassified Rathayibacter]|uniref:NYN domain-containing protein n=1 Tax=unclassified Rathayibacter TaxID=2609250 RepID=UPI0015E44BEF|nr:MULTISPECIES: NYN domain-containing protein [unclassified Rathayibacter]
MNRPLSTPYLPERPRTLHLIDIENMVGPDASAEEVTSFWTGYRRLAIGLGYNDHAIVASGPRFAPVAWFAIPANDVQRRVGRGIDGADFALIDAVELERYSVRFDRLVIASGDHAFAPLARRARKLGMRVHQVIGRGLPSRELFAACPTHSRLRFDTIPTGTGKTAAAEPARGAREIVKVAA